MPTTLADRFRQMPDERLLQLAHHEAAGLEPHALDLLRDELATRGLDRGVEASVAAQTTVLTDGDVERLVDATRALPCPICGRTEAPLTGGHVSQTISFLVMTTYKKRAVLACPDCLGAEARRGLWISAVAGWWGIPWGPIRTIQSVASNMQTLRTRHDAAPTRVLQQIVRDRPGLAGAALHGGPAAPRSGRRPGQPRRKA